VRGAISSLSTEVPGSPVEACDRLGQVASLARGGITATLEGKR